MKKFLFVFVFLSTFINAQTVIRYDYMETWDWAGLWWTPAASAGWFTNASVTPTESAVLYGLGSGTSIVEQDWYSLPNVTGLNINNQYQLKFKLASYTFSNPTATTRGVDVADYVSVQVSTNGGVSYVTEMRITGNSNATWPYTATGALTHTANGTFTNSAAPAGDVYQSPIGASTTGPSTITLNLPLNISQVAVDIYCRANSAGEEWWIDNIQLIEIVSLPVEMVSFEGSNTEQGNLLIWKTASEYNSSHYLIERSTTGEFNENTIIGIKQAAGNSTELLTYTFVDNDYRSEINYYRITQVDVDGQFKIYGPISINNTESIKKMVKIVNALGQEVDETATGVLYEVYEDGTSKKIIR
jgi:hypothetical protein